MRKLFKEKPILACVLTTLAFSATLLGVSFFTKLIINMLHLNITDSYPISMGIEILLATVGYGFIKMSNQEYIFKKPNIKSFFKGLFSGGYLVFIAVFALLGRVYYAFLQPIDGYGMLPVFHCICFAVYMAFVGMAEEFFFRGVVAEKLMCKFKNDPQGIYKAVILSGCLFGFIHIFNAFSTGIVAGVVQALSTSVIGMLLALMYYKNQNIWANVFVHGLLDFGILAMQGGLYGNLMGANDITAAMQYGLASLIGIIPYIIAVVVLLRAKNIAKIKENYGVC